MLLRLFEILQNPLSRRLLAGFIGVLGLAALLGSVWVLGWVGLLVAVPCVAVSWSATAIALAAIRVGGDPSAPPVLGWRSGWFDTSFTDGGNRNFVMARGWQDQEPIWVDSSLESQVAALMGEVQYVRELLARQGDASTAGRGTAPEASSADQ